MKLRAIIELFFADATKPTWKDWLNAHPDILIDEEDGLDFSIWNTRPIL